MIFRETLVAYDVSSNRVQVGPLGNYPDGPHWSDSFQATTGAAYVAARGLTGTRAQLAAVALMIHLVRDRGVDFSAAFAAFDQIEEFRLATFAWWQTLPPEFRA